MTVTTSVPETTGTDSPEQVRALRGLRLFEERGHEIERLPGDVYLVPGSGDRTYTVDYAAETCTCPDHTRREIACKHLYAVGISRATRRGGPVGELPAEPEPRPVRSCGKCGERAGSISAGTGRPLLLDPKSGEFFHLNCRPGAVSFGAALAGLERMGA